MLAPFFMGSALNPAEAMPNAATLNMTFLLRLVLINYVFKVCHFLSKLVYESAT